MKKIFGLILLLTVSLSSCKDFLTIVPADAIFLEDVQSIKQTLSPWLVNYSKNGAYNSTDAPAPWIPTSFSKNYQAYSDVWSFSAWSTKTALSEEDKRFLLRAELDHKEWANHYAIIGMMNLILNEIDKAKGEDNMRNYVKGEALIHRAVSFFKLLQYYAPMNDATLGVPVYLDTYGGFPDADLSRKNHKEVFSRILADLNEAERLLGITPPRPTYNIAYSYDFVYRIKAQVYQWKACGPVAEDSDWSNAAKAAEKAIELTGNALPYDIDKLDSDNFFGSNGESFPTEAYPESALFTTGSTLTDYGYDLHTWKTLYADNDNRKYRWFGIAQGKDPDQVQESDLNPTQKIKGFRGSMKPQWCYRLSEQYLILAEAYAHTDFSQAKKVLRQWQSVRYSGDGSNWFVPSDAESLLKEIYLERKREFIYEGDLLWLDMKRYNFTDSERTVMGFVANGLTSYDIRYNFKIPSTEYETNSMIKLNPGWEQYEVIDQKIE